MADCNASVTNNLKTYAKRSGTVDEGKDFENLIIANWALKLLFDNSIKNFEFKSNVDKYGAFDDVILDLEYNTKREEQLAVQLKYTSKLKTLTTAALNAESGDFSIPKYCKDFFKILEISPGFTGSVILFVKRRLSICQEDDEKQKKEQLNTGMLKYFIIEREKPELLEKLEIGSEECCCYRLEVDDTEDYCDTFKTELDKYRQFFSRFILCTTTTTTQELEDDIKLFFKNNLHAEGVFNNYYAFITKWNKQSVSLQRENVKIGITLSISNMFIERVSFENDLNSKTALLLESILKNTVTHLKKLHTVLTDFGNNKKKLVDNSLISKWSNLYLFKNDEEDLKYIKLLWLMRKCPLILRDHPSVRKIIELSSDFKYILISDSDDNIPNVSNFRYLSDLKLHSELYQKILETFKCTLQHKSVVLRDLVTVNDKIPEIISTHEICSMANNNLKIDNSPVERPKPFISPRYLSKFVVNEILSNNIPKDVTIFIECSKSDDFENLKRKYANNERIKIMKKILPNLIKFSNKAYYHLKMDDSNNIEFIGSNTDRTHLNGHYEFLEEKEIINCESDINILLGNAGSGKTTFLKKFVDTSDLTLWTLFLNTQNLSDFFITSKNDLEAFKEHLLKILENLNSFEKSLFELFWENKAIRFLWDALDEVEEDDLIYAISLIKQLINGSTKQWVSSRSYLRNQIEKELETCSRTLLELNQNQQKQYIQEKLKLDETELEKWFSKDARNLLFLYNNNLLGIPFHIYLLTEVWLHNQIRCDAEDLQFTLDQIYEKFIHDKIKYFFTNKLGYDLNKSRNRKRTDQEIRELKDFYKKISMIKYFENRFLNKLNIKYDNKILEDIKSNGDEVGFIVNVFNDSSVNFFHNSVAEFLVAQFLYENWTKIKHFKSILFKEKHNTIRFFFDLLMAKNCKAHIAVLYKDWQFLNDCTEEDILKSDIGGRNIVQLLSAWGPKIPLVNTDKFCNGFCTINSNDVLKDSRIEKFIERLEDYRNKIDLYKKDILFDLNSFSYASKAESFLALGILSAKSTDIDRQPNFKFKKYYYVTIYYCLLYDYAEILSMIDTVPLIKTQVEFFGFEHLLALHNCVNWVRKIVGTKQFKLKLKFDITAATGDEPLHCVFLNYNVFTKERDIIEIAKFIIQEGGNLNTQNLFMQTPLHLAIGTNYHEVVKLFLENNADTTVVDFSRNTPQDYLQNIPLLFNFTRNKEQVIKNKSNYDEMALLQKACRKNNYSKFKKKICKKLYFMRVNFWGRPLLEHACLEKSSKIFKFLLKQGADPNFLNCFNQNILHVACINSDIKIISDIIVLDRNVKLNVGDGDGKYPIHYAVKYGNLEIIKLLLDNAAEINVGDYFNDTSLHLASSGSTNVRTVSFTRFTRKLEVQIENIAKNCVQIVELLLEKNAEPNLQNAHQRTPLHLACLHQHEINIQLLLGNNANPNIVDFLQNTPLHYSCKLNNVEILKLLLKHNADVNITSYNGKTPLHIVCKKDYKDIAKLLLQKGADVNIQDVYGMTPLDYARLYDNKQIIQLLDSFS